jgi:hypothetical protein
MIQGMKRFTRESIVRACIGILAGALALYTIPITWCSRGATKWLEGEREAQRKLARGVQRLVFDLNLSLIDFRTGDEQFDGEWLFGTYLMAGIGFCQIAMAHPDLRDEMEPLRYCQKFYEKV